MENIKNKSPHLDYILQKYENGWCKGVDKTGKELLIDDEGKIVDSGDSVSVLSNGWYVVRECRVKIYDNNRELRAQGVGVASDITGMKDLWKYVDKKGVTHILNREGDELFKTKLQFTYTRGNIIYTDLKGWKHFLDSSGKDIIKAKKIVELPFADYLYISTNEQYKVIINNRGEEKVRMKKSKITIDDAIKKGYEVERYRVQNDRVFWAYTDNKGIRHLIDDEGYERCNGCVAWYYDVGGCEVVEKTGKAIYVDEVGRRSSHPRERYGAPAI